MKSDTDNKNNSNDNSNPVIRTDIPIETSLYQVCQKIAARKILRWLQQRRAKLVSNKGHNIDGGVELPQKRSDSSNESKASRKRLKNSPTSLSVHSTRETEVDFNEMKEPVPSSLFPSSPSSSLSHFNFDSIDVWDQLTARIFPGIPYSPSGSATTYRFHPPSPPPLVSTPPQILHHHPHALYTQLWRKRSSEWQCRERISRGNSNLTSPKTPSSSITPLLHNKSSSLFHCHPSLIKSMNRQRILRHKLNAVEAFRSNSKEQEHKTIEPQPLLPQQEQNRRQISLKDRLQQSAIQLQSSTSIPLVRANSFDPPSSPLPKSTDPIDQEAKLPTLYVRENLLPNGLRYILHPLDTRPAHTACLRLLVKVGSWNETSKESGFAHFIEHLGFQSTTEYKPNQVMDFMRSMGAAPGCDVNANTRFEDTVYRLDIPILVLHDHQSTNERKQSPSSTSSSSSTTFSSSSSSSNNFTGHDHISRENRLNLATGLRILRALAQSILFLSDDVEKERSIIKEEQRHGHDVIADFLLQLMFDSPPYLNRLPIGSRAIIEKAEIDDLRNFYHRWYTADRITLIIVGEIDLDLTEALVCDLFSSLKPSKERFPVPALIQTPDTAPSVQKRIKFHLLPVSSTHSSSAAIHLLYHRSTPLNNGTLQESLVDLSESAYLWLILQFHLQTLNDEEETNHGTSRFNVEVQPLLEHALWKTFLLISTTFIQSKSNGNSSHPLTTTNDILSLFESLLLSFRRLSVFGPNSNDYLLTHSMCSDLLTIQMERGESVDDVLKIMREYVLGRSSKMFTSKGVGNRLVELMTPELVQQAAHNILWTCPLNILLSLPSHLQPAGEELLKKLKDIEERISQLPIYLLAPTPNLLPLTDVDSKREINYAHPNLPFSSFTRPPPNGEISSLESRSYNEESGVVILTFSNGAKVYLHPSSQLNERANNARNLSDNSSSHTDYGIVASVQAEGGGIAKSFFEQSNSKFRATQLATSMALFGGWSLGFPFSADMARNTSRSLYSQWMLTHKVLIRELKLEALHRVVELTCHSSSQALNDMLAVLHSLFNMRNQVAHTTALQRHDSNTDGIPVGERISSGMEEDEWYWPPFLVNHLLDWYISSNILSHQTSIDEFHQLILSVNTSQFSYYNPISVEECEQLRNDTYSLRYAQNYLADAFSCPADFEWTFVGSLPDLDTVVIPLLCRYIGSIPARSHLSMQTNGDVDIANNFHQKRFPLGQQMITLFAGSHLQVMVQLSFPSPDLASSLELTLVQRLLAAIQNRLLLVLRGEKAALYHLDVSLQWSDGFTPIVIAISFACGYERVEETIQTCLQTIREMQTNQSDVHSQVKPNNIQETSLSPQGISSAKRELSSPPSSLLASFLPPSPSHGPPTASELQAVNELGRHRLLAEAQTSDYWVQAAAAPVQDRKQKDITQSSNKNMEHTDLSSSYVSSLLSHINNGDWLSAEDIDVVVSSFLSSSNFSLAELIGWLLPLENFTCIRLFPKRFNDGIKEVVTVDISKNK